MLTELIRFEGHGTSIKTEQYKPSKQSKLLGKTYVNNVQVKAFTDTIKIPNFPDTQFLFYGLTLHSPYINMKCITQY